MYVGDFSPNVRPVPAMRARTWITQGRTDDALAWARDQGLSVEDELSYLREYEHVTLARALLGHASSLERGDRAAGAPAASPPRPGTGRAPSSRSSCCRRSHPLSARDVPAALATLERALALAEPEGYVRTFVDEGPPMAALLDAAAKRGIARDYVTRLLAAFGTSGVRTPVRQGLVDPLSERELDVLRLLGSELTGPEIARELVVSLNTVRTHTKAIYAKLGVNTRRAAVRRAAELDLLARAR